MRPVPYSLCMCQNSRLCQNYHIHGRTFQALTGLLPSHCGSNVTFQVTFDLTYDFRITFWQYRRIAEGRQTGPTVSKPSRLGT